MNAPTLADQVRHLTAQGLGVVQVADQLHISAHAAFAAGARILHPGDPEAVAASMRAAMPAELDEHTVWALWVAAHTLEEIAARYDVSMFLAGVMQDVADKHLGSWGAA
ncbi:hypothetical protein ACQEVZ_38610 [Dactylosporangium sp. CA-152071]|uniref:hypothetical protein n=1 Tax=Dactylosporangium sp. CA-152071 TaxID=3239933 RepID=UPI003D923A47